MFKLDSEERTSASRLAVRDLDKENLGKISHIE